MPSMKKLKHLCLDVLLTEGENVHNLSAGDFGEILDVSFNTEENYMKFDFLTKYKKKYSLIVKMSEFKKWVENNKELAGKMFSAYINDFIGSAKETTQEGLNEIIDDDGNIMADDGMPNNSTNTMVASPRFDLEKIIKRYIPKSIRFYSGDMGIGAVTW